MEFLKKHNVKISGNGPRTIVFAHGFGCDQSMWRFITPAFEADYRIILFDLVGAGNSDASMYDPVKYSSLKGYSKDVLEICRELNLENPVFVGHSVSAMIGVLAAIQAPKLFSKLVLVSPSPCYFNDGDYVGGFNRQDIEAMLETVNKDYLGWARSMAPAIMGHADRPELGAELTNSFCQTNPEIAKYFARVVFLSDNRSDLKKVSVPSLVLQCSQDIIASEAVGRFVHNNLPKSEFVQLKATGHCPHVSEPEETIEAIQNFLRKSEVRGPITA
ncbi:MAG: alpha/beta fold hydrolase [Pseudobdellovibrionaceae bacterium]